MSVSGAEYPRRKRRSSEQDPIRVLPPIIVEMTEDQVEEAAELLARLLVSSVCRREEETCDYL